MNEQNPPPSHLANAEAYRRIQNGVLFCSVAILVYLLVAIDSGNVMSLLLIFLFLALPLTFAFFVVDKEIKYWVKPCQLYSQEFVYKPALRSGLQVPVQVEYQFPNTGDMAEDLERLSTAAFAGLSKAFSSLAEAPDYEETRRILLQAIEPEAQELDFDILRVRVLNIQIPISQQHYSVDMPLDSAASSTMRARAATAHAR